MKIKAGDNITPKEAQVYRARKQDIGAAVKKIEDEVKHRITRMGDLAVELYQIEVALAAHAAKKADKGRTSKSAP